MTDAKQETTTPLDWISVEGFRSIARLERLALRPINVLIGANGSGKSNFIAVFALLRALRADRLHTYVGTSGGAERNLHFGAGLTKQIRVDVSFGGGREKHHVLLKPTEKDELLVGSERFSGDPMKVLDHLAHAKGVVDRRVAELIQERLNQWRVYHFPDTRLGSPMLRTAQLHDNRFLREDGENIAAFLYRLKMKEQAAYNRIRDTFRFVAPFFEDFVLEPLAVNDLMIRLVWRHRVSDAHFDISTLSDGSLRFLALATLLLQPAHLRPSVILLDEPELGLHPRAITMLCSLVKSISVETQVVLATQSPFVVDHFEPEDVIVVDRLDGASVFQRPSAERLEEWLEEYSLGDLWIKNELGGCPSYEAAPDDDRD